MTTAIALAERVAELLGGRSVATAESCTAGRIAVALAAAPDAASFFRGTLVAYQEDVKRNDLGVRALSVYSGHAAAEMAVGVAHHFGAEAAIATTGVVGDEEVEGVPPGTVFIATLADGQVQSHRYHFDGQPGEICDQARDQGLRDLISALTPGAVAPVVEPVETTSDG